MTLPPPLSFLPSFLLNQAGGLVLKAVCATILPRFGQLVAEDYRRWSRGEPRVGGSLAPEPQMMQELEGSPYYFPPPSAEGLAPPSLGPPPPTLATPKTAESTRNGSSNSD
mmetsp:Transcript_8151/g.7133  ORF Transcript_8151/g.7133 Transcript_8151/m.7133 type:complete len:111 (+) Transcript_8151:1-333(+)